MHHVPENSTFLATLREQYPSLAKTLFMKEKVVTSCSYIQLPATWDEYFSTLSQRGRRNLRRAMKMLQKEHVVEFKKYIGGEDLREQLEILFKLHLKRWEDSKFLTPEARNFYIDVSKAFFQNKWLDLSFLKANGKAVSAFWGFNYNNMCWAMTIASDTDYSYFSVGQLHFMKLIESSIQNGQEIFDFLKGEQAYKFHWTDRKKDNIRVTITGRSLVSRCRAVLLQIFTKYNNIRTRSFRENIALLLKKIRS